MATPQLLFPDGTPQYTAKRAPGFLSLLARQVPLACLKKTEDHYLMLDEDLTVPREIDFCTGCFFAVSYTHLKEKFKTTVGGQALMEGVMTVSYTHLFQHGALRLGLLHSLLQRGKLLLCGLQCRFACGKLCAGGVKLGARGLKLCLALYHQGLGIGKLLLLLRQRAGYRLFIPGKLCLAGLLYTSLRCK